jgi:dihydroflavonol-4-reductase
MSGISVVTGATGHLGPVLVGELLSRGEHVRCVVRHDHWSSALPTPGSRVSRCSASLSDVSALARAFEGAAVVYHAAALISLSPLDAERLATVNVEGTRNVLSAARAAGVRRLVYVSSIETFPLGDRNFPITGMEPIDPERTALAYGASKARAAKLVLEKADEGLETVVCAPTAAVGPPDVRPSRIGAAIRDAATGRLPAIVPGSFDFVDVRDVAAGIAEAGVRGVPGTTYVLGGHTTSLRELIELVCTEAGTQVPWFTAPPALIAAVSPFVRLAASIAGREPRFTRDSVYLLQLGVSVDLSLCREHLGYEPRPIEETVADTVRYFLGRTNEAYAL